MRLSLAGKLHLLLVPVVATGAVTAWLAHHSLQNNASALVESRKVKELAVTSLSLLLTQDDSSKALMLDGSNTDASMRKIQAYDEGQNVAKQLRELTRSEKLLGLIERLNQIDEVELRPLDTKLLETMSGGKPEATMKMFATEYEPVRAKYESILRELVTQAEAEAILADEQMKAKNARSVTAIIAALTVGSGIVAAILLVVTRHVTRGLRRTAALLDSEAASAMATSAHFVRASAELAEAASEQATSLQETSASLEEMSSMTKRNAEYTSQAKTLASGARGAADTGASNMTEMCAAMSDIKSASDGISKIIKTIDEIAFQTNILALNAAVEAARAGEAGMGFAVVADEVRNLAQRSAGAAKETAERIQDSIEKSDRGAQISTRVVSGFEDIVSKVRQVDELIVQIAQASSEQSVGIQRVTTATQQMESITRKNAGIATQEAESASRLTTQAANVGQAVHQLLDILGQPTSLTDSRSAASTHTSDEPPQASSNHRTPTGLQPATQPRALQPSEAPIGKSF